MGARTPTPGNESQRCLPLCLGMTLAGLKESYGVPGIEPWSARNMGQPRTWISQGPGKRLTRYTISDPSCMISAIDAETFANNQHQFEIKKK